MFLSRVLLRLLCLGAALLFLCTLLFPFLSFQPVFLSFPEAKCHTVIYFWSFMRREEVTCFRMFNGGFTHKAYDCWFSDYWFNQLFYFIDFRDSQNTSKNEISWTLIFLFSIQIFTFLTAVASIFTDKRFLAFIPVALCLITTALMARTFTLLNSISWNKFTYEIGYWLTYPSDALFITSALIKLKTASKSTNKINGSEKCILEILRRKLTIFHYSVKRH